MYYTIDENTEAMPESAFFANFCGELFPEKLHCAQKRQFRDARVDNVHFIGGIFRYLSIDERAFMVYANKG